MVVYKNAEGHGMMKYNKVWGGAMLYKYHQVCKKNISGGTMKHAEAQRFERISWGEVC